MDSRTVLALAPLAVIGLGFVVWCLVVLVRSPARTLPKPLWAVLILASVPLGGILYLVLGRARPGDDEPSSPPAKGGPPPPPAGAAPASAPAPSSRPFEPRGAGPAQPVGAPGEAAPPVVATVELAKAYADRLALAGVDLAVPTGAVYGLVGPNGSGKTTLLSILAGLRRPTSGEIHVGIDRRRIGVLPDTPTFDPWLTGREVVDLARALVAPELASSATDAALARTGLTGAADRRCGGYSRGMLQRLGLAATVVGGPDLLLLDEPCSALDPQGRREVLDLVADLGGEATVLFCSHILSDVQQVCDTVGVLKDGRLLFQGPLADLLDRHVAPVWTVRLRGDRTPAVRALTAAGWVRSVEELPPDRLRVTGRSVAEVETGLVPLLATAGVPVVAVEPVAADLEAVFLELVS